MNFAYLVEGIRLRVLTAVLLEGVGEREFTEFVTDFIFGNEHGDMHSSIVHENRAPYPFGHNRRASTPSFDLSLGVFTADNFVMELLVEVRSFFE